MNKQNHRLQYVEAVDGLRPRYGRVIFKEEKEKKQPHPPPRKPTLSSPEYPPPSTTTTNSNGFEEMALGPPGLALSNASWKELMALRASLSSTLDWESRCFLHVQTSRQHAARTILERLEEQSVIAQQRLAKELLARLRYRRHIEKNKTVESNPSVVESVRTTLRGYDASCKTLVALNKAFEAFVTTFEEEILRPEDEKKEGEEDDEEQELQKKTLKRVPKQRRITITSESSD